MLQKAAPGRARTKRPSRPLRGAARHEEVWMKCAELQNRDTRSDRQCDFPHTAGENEQSAQAVTVPLVSQKEAAEADQCGKRHSDLTGSVHVSFPQHFPPMTRRRRSLSKLARSVRHWRNEGRGETRTKQE